jgi:hypothetical protein
MNTDLATKKPGRKPDPRRQLYAGRFSVKESTMRHWGTDFLDTLDRCADDDARRLIIKAMQGVKGGTKHTRDRYKYRLVDKRRPPKREVDVDRLMALAAHTRRA